MSEREALREAIGHMLAWADGLRVLGLHPFARAIEREAARLTRMAVASDKASNRYPLKGAC
jgi:hypothetical protein